MKILICASEYPTHTFSSGIGNVTYNLVEQLKKKGVNCIVCSPVGPDVVLGSMQLIQKTGILGLLYFWACVIKYIKTEDYDIIWLHSPLPLFKISSKSLICTYHSTYFGLTQQMQQVNAFRYIYFRIAALIERMCLKNIPDAPFIGVSTQVCHELSATYPNKKEIFSILNGVNTEEFSTQCIGKYNFKKDLGIEHNLVVLFIGRLDQIKSVDLVIKSFEPVHTTIPSARLLIVGDGAEKNNLIKLSEKLNLADSIIFCGAQPHDVIPQFLYYSDVVICPWSGLVLFEAMASGKSIIASDIEWHAEVIVHMQNGILVEYQNITELTNAVILLLTNSDLSNTLGKKARDFAVNTLDWNIISDQYFDIFSHLNDSEYLKSKSII